MVQLFLYFEQHKFRDIGSITLKINEDLDTLCQLKKTTQPCDD